MESTISVSIPTEQFLDLVNFLRSNNDPRDPVNVVRTAIEYWMDNASWKPELLSQTDTSGYQWKNLFLPSGTQIRMQYKGQYYYAKVEGDSIIYNEKPVSPSTLANTIAGGSRNAWRDLWIKRPDPVREEEWKLADNLRRAADKLEKNERAILKLADERGKDVAAITIGASMRKVEREFGLTDSTEADEKHGMEYVESLRAKYEKSGHEH